MGWLIKSPTPHSCPRPSETARNNGGYDIGSLWQCDECSQVWKLVAGEYGEYFLKISARRALRELKKQTDNQGA